MMVWDLVGVVVFAAMLGMVGQLARVVPGLKKARERGDDFDFARLASGLIVALAVGSVAGVLYIVAGPLDETGVELAGALREEAMAIVGAGYAGTDFIEGFVR